MQMLLAGIGFLLGAAVFGLGYWRGRCERRLARPSFTWPNIDYYSPSVPLSHETMQRLYDLCRHDASVPLSRYDAEWLDRFIYAERLKYYRGHPITHIDGDHYARAKSDDAIRAAQAANDRAHKPKQRVAIQSGRLDGLDGRLESAESFIAMHVDEVEVVENVRGTVRQLVWTGELPKPRRLIDDNETLTVRVDNVEHEMRERFVKAGCAREGIEKRVDSLSNLVGEVARSASEWEKKAHPSLYLDPLELKGEVESLRGEVNALTVLATGEDDAERDAALTELATTPRARGTMPRFSELRGWKELYAAGLMGRFKSEDEPELPTREQVRAWLDTGPDEEVDESDDE